MGRPWYLLADIGGTNARFAVGDPASGELHEARTLVVAEHPSFAEALGVYLAHVRATGLWASQPSQGCLAVAATPNGNLIRFTNSDWVIDRQMLAGYPGVPPLHVINDFAALGYAVAGFCDDDWEQLGAGAASSGEPVGLLGPGTGLGVCTVVPVNEGLRVLPGEGGHVDFAPVDETEMHIQRLLLTRYPRVSVERLLSGSGLQNIYWALGELRASGQHSLAPADISAAGLAGEDPLAVETLTVFCRILGSVAGNLALTVGARGGLYVAGGIAPRMLRFLRTSEFRERFLAKGRFRDYLAAMPTRIVTREDAGLIGVFKFLDRG